MKTASIKQSAQFAASPREVYAALMDSRKHAAFTSAGARISQKVGGTFKIFDGYASGKNLELVPGKKIVQAWRAEEDGWPAGHFSTATFALQPFKGGTKLAFTQADVPDVCAKNISQGWKDFYWTPLKNYFQHSRS